MVQRFGWQCAGMHAGEREWKARKMTGELDHNCRGTGLVAALGVQVYNRWKGEDASGNTGKLTHAKADVTR